MCTLKIKFGSEDQPMKQLSIHNVYNPTQTSEGRRSVLPVLQAALAAQDSEEQIALGDFNLHHRMWGGLRVRQEDTEAEELLELMESSDMSNTLKPGTITYEEGQGKSTIDLCWMTLGLVDRVIRSEVDRDLDHDSDHLPISTLLDLRILQGEPKPRRNWKGLDVAKFQEALKETLPGLARPRTKTALDTYTAEVVDAINAAIAKVLPLKRFSPKARAGWNEECTNAIAKRNGCTVSIADTTQKKRGKRIV
jgi:hypothetical protein